LPNPQTTQRAYFQILHPGRTLEEFKTTSVWETEPTLASRRFGLAFWGQHMDAPFGAWPPGENSLRSSGCADIDNHFAKVPPFKQSVEWVGRILQAFDHLFAIIDFFIFNSTRHLFGK
jgi:hypothetical protein